MTFKEFKKKYEKKTVEEYPNNVDENPVISICIQAYQHEKYIEKCIDSVIAQECSYSYEILIGEDDSDDETRNICIEYAEQYPELIRLFLHNRENNIKVEGRPTGRFNAFYNFFSARGSFIATCDGDDYYCSKSKLQKQVDFLSDNSDYAICAHEVYSLYENGELEAPKKSMIQKRSGGYYLYSNFTHTSSVIYRRNEFFDDIPDFLMKFPMGDFPRNFIISQDSKVYKYKDYMTVRRIHQKGIWSKDDQLTNYNKSLNALKLMKPYVNQPNIKYYKGGLNRFYLKKAILLLIQGQNADETLNNVDTSDAYRGVYHWIIYYMIRFGVARPVYKQLDSLLNKI